MSLENSDILVSLLNKIKKQDYRQGVIDSAMAFGNITENDWQWYKGQIEFAVYEIEARPTKTGTVSK